MITTFKPMPSPVSHRSRSRPPIIAALLLLAAVLTGCGLAVRIGYDQAGPLAFRWLDGYIDFNDAQSLRVRAGLDEWTAWHRRTQLPDYADLLARARTEVLADTTPDRMCAWGRELRGRFDTAVARAAPAIVDVAQTLTPAQLANVEKRYAERNREYRDEFLQRDPDRRRSAAVERQIARAEMFYDRLDGAQRRFVARAVAESPYDAETAYAERVRRQQDALAVLRRVTAARLPRAEAEAELHAYVQRLDRSPDEAYRRYAERLAGHECGFAAALHNSTSVAQRRAAADKFKGYEDDLRALAGASAVSTPIAQPSLGGSGAQASTSSSKARSPAASATPEALSVPNG
jgi:hypothetical protein